MDVLITRSAPPLAADARRPGSRPQGNGLDATINVCISTYMYVYIYTHICYTYIYIYGDEYLYTRTCTGTGTCMRL